MISGRGKTVGDILMANPNTFEWSMSDFRLRNDYILKCSSCLFIPSRDSQIMTTRPIFDEFTKIISELRPVLKLLHATKRLSPLVLLFSISIAVQAKAFGEIIISGFNANSNNRFTNNSQFILNGRNLSGVGLTTGGGNGAWGTLISRNVVIAAKHNQPVGPISFYSDNNPASVALNYSVVSSQRIGTSDLWLGKLNAEVDASISHYQFATEILTGTNPNPNPVLVTAGSFQGANGYVFGLSPAANINTQDQAVGRNIIDGYIQNIPFNNGIDTNPIGLLYLNRDLTNPEGFEATLQLGDSGAPFFIERNGSLLLMGVNTALFGSVANPTGSGVSYIGNSATSIQSFVTANAVPEPSTLLLIGIVACGIGIRKTIMRNR